MRRIPLILAVAAATLACATQVSAKVTGQSAHCASEAREQKLTGARRTDFLRTCQKGPLAASTPTAPTAPSKESQAVTKPSGVDRNTRATQCAAEADRKHLSATARKQFQLSCIATAGPVSEGETATVQPHPAKQIKGIGVNNYKHDARPAASSPDPTPPAAATPKP